MDTQPLRIPVLSPEREPVGEMELPAYIAGQPPREHLLFEVVKMQLANRRAGTASTKTRGEVRGGGKKPWRQGDRPGPGWEHTLSAVGRWGDRLRSATPFLCLPATA